MRGVGEVACKRSSTRPARRYSSRYDPKFLDRRSNHTPYSISLTETIELNLMSMSAPLDQTFATQGSDDAGAVSFGIHNPCNVATISSGFEKGDFLVREEKGQRVYFDFFEEAFNYVSSIDVDHTCLTLSRTLVQTMCLHYLEHLVVAQIICLRYSMNLLV